MELLEQMYLALKSVPCRCKYKRVGSVPLWAKNEATGAVGRILEEQCSLCAAIDRYEAEVLNTHLNTKGEAT